MVKISIDRGGTFTDIYAKYEDKIYIKKLLSNDPNNYDDAPREGIRLVLEEIFFKELDSKSVDEDSIDWIRMGTTVATNALLEKKGAKTLFLTTKGFADSLEIGYQNRADIFDLNIKKPKQLYDRVIEIDARVIPKGDAFEVIKEIDRKSLHKVLLRAKKDGFDSIAICFMHSYGYQRHELIAKEIAKAIGFSQISVSSEILPIVKFVNRASSSVIDAYLTPHIKEYIDSFKGGFKDNLESKKLLFMQSNGGLCDAEKFSGANSILSGPAGGVVGYSSIYKNKPIIGFDMGGTSTDVSRYDGEFELSFENEIDGIKNSSPQMQILTVASGGGSRLFYKNSMFVVGPESSSAHPGPICYKKGGYLSITDANLVLNRVLPNYFPKIFGANQDEALDRDASFRAFEELRDSINIDYETKGLKPLSLEEVALGFIKVANENMIKPIKELSALKGFDIKEHILASFGGAGAQHACSIAKSLGIEEIFIHRYSGILSAFGMSVADIIKDYRKPVNLKLNKKSLKIVNSKFKKLIHNFKEDGIKQSFDKYLLLRYKGTNNSFLVKEPIDSNYKRVFKEIHFKTFGFDFDDKVIDIDEMILKITTKEERVRRELIQKSKATPEPIETIKCYFENGYLDTKVYNLSLLYAGDVIDAPAIIINDTSTILIEPNSKAKINEYGDVKIVINHLDSNLLKSGLNPVNLALFNNLFSSIAEQMGRVLQRTAISTNIKERLDFSCALFDEGGNLVANAPHIPVHLGSISQSVKYIIKKYGDRISKGDVFITNSPFEGGSHLPDITVITPYVENSKVQFFVASRAHHADIGGITPGSMPSFSTSIDEEGALLKAFKVVKNGNFQEMKLINILNRAKAREISNNISDIHAQISANNRGILLLHEMIGKYTLDSVKSYMQYIQDVSESRVREFFKSLEVEKLKAKDYLDNGSRIALKILIDENGEAIFDFSKSAKQNYFNQNAPKSITYSAVVYVLRALLNEDLPLNEGFLKPIKFIFGKSSILNPDENLAVVGGNVTTSQRVVDVLLQAFGICADSGGCMNNLSFGNKNFGYYETIAGGSGATATSDGASGVHTHMTNTRITDSEIFERRFPVILREFSISKGSGGKGKFRGGDGVIREIEFLDEVSLNLLTERRSIAPNGAFGGSSGARGENLLIRDGVTLNVGSKANLKLKKRDRVKIKTPAGGGFGS